MAPSLLTRSPKTRPVADKAVFLPRRDSGIGDTEGAGYNRGADLYHQQRPSRLPERAAAAQAR